MERFQGWLRGSRIAGEPLRPQELTAR